MFSEPLLRKYHYPFNCHRRISCKLILVNVFLARSVEVLAWHLSRLVHLHIEIDVADECVFSCFLKEINPFINKQKKRGEIAGVF